MAPRYLTNDLHKRLIGIRPNEEDPTQDSGYQSSDSSDRLLSDSNDISHDKRYQARPLEKLGVAPPIPPRYLCGICKTLFDVFEDLGRHIKASSATCAALDGHWMCGKCTKPFTEGRSLKRHVLTTGCMTDTTKPSYTCQTCGLVYGRKDNLNRHEKTHRCRKRRKHAHTKTIPSPFSVEVTAHLSSDSVAPSFDITSPTLSDIIGFEPVHTICSHSSPNPDPRLPSFPRSIGASFKPVTANIRENSTLTTASCEPVTSNSRISQLGSTGTAQRESTPRLFTHRNLLNLPLRPKHANKRPGPKRRMIECPSCHKRIGTSQQELTEHAKLHSGGRYSLDLLCTQCMICFEREKDFRYHEMSATKYGNCGFLNHEACGGHHPLAEGEVCPSPDGDHARMRIAVQNWELQELQDYQLRHDEAAEALPHQGEDCERWTVGARSLKANSLWSQRSRPLSKTSAPSHTDWTARSPFRNFADRYEQVKAVASLNKRKISWQIKCRVDLAAIGAIMNADSYTLGHMLRRGRDPNVLLYTTDTRAANIKYSEKLSGANNFISPLTLASEQGYLDGMGMLICAGADVNALDDNCRTALDWAMSRRNKMACAVLLAHGASYVDHGDGHVEDAFAFLQAAKDEFISSLICCHRETPHVGTLACYAHHAILKTDHESFKSLLSFGFSMDSKPQCVYHAGRDFQSLAQDMAPHLLKISPHELDLELLLEAITTNDILAIQTLLIPGTILPPSMCTGDAILDFARGTPGVWPEVIDVLAGAIPGIRLSTPLQESFWYSRVGVTECG